MENQIIKGDCFEVMQQFPDGIFDAIITDPPYGINLEHWDKCVDIPLLTTEVKRLLGNGFYSFFGQMPTVIDWINNANQAGLKYKEHISWVKRVHSPSADLCRSHESIFVYKTGQASFFKKKGCYEDVKIPGILVDVATVESFVANFQEIAAILKGKSPYQTKRKSGLESFSRFNRIKGPRHIIECNFTNVWSFLPGSKQRWQQGELFHPCEKPIPLMKRLVELLTPENGLILDPFAGSGTLAIACLETNRRYVCIEQDDKYFDVMQNRITQWHNDQLNKTGTHELPDGIERVKQQESGQLSLF